MVVDDLMLLLQNRQEMLLVDLAVHFLLDMDEVRALLHPLIADGRVELFWQARKTQGRKCCGCDAERHVRWLGKQQSE